MKTAYFNYFILKWHFFFVSFILYSWRRFFKKYASKKFDLISNNNDTLANVVQRLRIFIDHYIRNQFVQCVRNRVNHNFRNRFDHCIRNQFDHSIGNWSRFLKSVSIPYQKSGWITISETGLSVFTIFHIHITLKNLSLYELSRNF